MKWTQVSRSGHVDQSPHYLQSREEGEQQHNAPRSHEAGQQRQRHPREQREANR